MNILITGANGFIGRNLKEYFEKQKTMKNRMTKMSIETRDFSTVTSHAPVHDYVKVLQSLGMPDQ